MECSKELNLLISEKELVFPKWLYANTERDSKAQREHLVMARLVVLSLEMSSWVRVLKYSYGSVGNTSKDTLKLGLKMILRNFLSSCPNY